MGYRLFSDMTADVSDELMAGMPTVEFVPMQVEVGDESYTYGPEGDLTVEYFYAEQRGGKFASTSQINPMVYRECFEKALMAGEDVLYLCFSSGLSGTLQSARLCAQELREDYPDRKVVVMDTLCASVGEAMLVREAARMQQEGLSIDELAGRFYISKYHMMRRFKEETGYTIHNYVVTKRLMLARDRISAGVPVGEACYACGFRDYSAFARAYKKLFSVSPRSAK